MTASAADPRQAGVNVEMHKKPEGVSYRRSDPASQEDTRATPPLLAPVAACGSFRHCHGGHSHRHQRLRQQPGRSPAASAARGRCHPKSKKVAAALPKSKPKETDIKRTTIFNRSKAAGDTEPCRLSAFGGLRKALNSIDCEI